VERRAPGGGRSWLGAIAVLCASVAPARAEEGREPRAPSLWGFNIDLIPRAVDDDARLEAGREGVAWLPQMWLGTRSQRLWLDGDRLVLPDGVEEALLWLRHPAGDAYLALIDPDFSRVDSGPDGPLVAGWRRRVLQLGRTSVVRWRRESLRVRCGYSWRLAVDPASRFGLRPGLTLRAVSLLSESGAGDAGGEVGPAAPSAAPRELVWFGCGPVWVDR